VHASLGSLVRCYINEALVVSYSTLTLTLIEMAEDRQQIAKDPKGVFNRLKKAIRLGSRSAPHSCLNLPSTIVAPPVVTVSSPALFCLH